MHEEMKKSGFPTLKSNEMLVLLLVYYGCILHDFLQLSCSKMRNKPIPQYGPAIYTTTF